MRDIIKGLLRVLPGYKGYEEKEKRRESDKILRTHLAQQFSTERDTITRLIQRAVDSGNLEYIARLEENIQILNRFIARLESAPRGYASWFSEAQINESDLDQLYEFDARLADSIPLLREQITHVEKQLQAGEEVDEAVNTLRDFMDGLNRQLDARQEFVALGKRPSE